MGLESRGLERRQNPLWVEGQGGSRKGERRKKEDLNKFRYCCFQLKYSLWEKGGREVHKTQET